MLSFNFGLLQMYYSSISDEPEIEVDKAWVHGGLGHESVISCIVYGEPTPGLKWYRDTMVVAGNENRIMEQFGFRYFYLLSMLQSSLSSCIKRQNLQKGQ